MEKMREFMDRMYDEMWDKTADPAYGDMAWTEMDAEIYRMSQDDEEAFNMWADAHGVDIHSEEGYEDFCYWCWDHE